jgi:hypothetical protein
MATPQIPDEPDGLTEADSSRWQFVAARLKQLEADIMRLKRATRRDGGKMMNRAGGYSTTPEWRQLQRAEKAAEDCRSVLVRLLGKANPKPPADLTEAQMRAEFDATLALGRNCPDETVDEVIALTRLAAGDPPDADAADQVAAILKQWPSKADRAAVKLPSIDA